MADSDPYMEIAAQTGGNILQGGLNARRNKKAFQRTAEYNTAMFNKTNKYNHPVQQAARMREAGINPALAYGKIGGTGNATQVSGPDYKASAQPDLNMGLNYSTLQLQRSQIEANETSSNLNTTKAATEAKNTALVSAQGAKTSAEAETAQATAALADELVQTSLAGQIANIDNTKANTINTKARTENTNQQTKVSKATLPKTLEQLEQNIKLTKTDIDYKRVMKDQAYANTKLTELKERREEYKSQRENQGLPVDVSVIGAFNAMVASLSDKASQIYTYKLFNH